LFITGVKAAAVAALSEKLNKSEKEWKDQKELIKKHEKPINEMERVELFF
jgi:hypothetical protein